MKKAHTPFINNRNNESKSCESGCELLFPAVLPIKFGLTQNVSFD